MAATCCAMNGNIIDNTDGGAGFTSVSALANDQGLLPAPGHRPASVRIATGRTSAHRLPIASENAAVSAEFGVNDANSGYQFWLFDPNGTYSRRCSSATPTRWWVHAPGAQAAAHLRFGNLITNPVPLDLMLNVRIRGRVNGTYNAFGPTCRVMVVSSHLPAPPPSWWTTSNNPNHSCGWTAPSAAATRWWPILGRCQPIPLPLRADWRQLRTQHHLAHERPAAEPRTSPLVAGASYNVFVQAS